MSRCLYEVARERRELDDLWCGAALRIAEGRNTRTKVGETSPDLRRSTKTSNVRMVAWVACIAEEM